MPELRLAPSAPDGGTLCPRQGILTCPNAVTRSQLITTRSQLITMSRRALAGH